MTNSSPKAPGIIGLPIGLAEGALLVALGALSIAANGHYLSWLPWLPAALFLAVRARGASDKLVAARVRAAAATEVNRRDMLTGLLNRAAFMAELDRRVADGEAERLAVLFFDLDRFKQVNDTFGHRAGDRLLVEIARRIEAKLDSSAAFARLSGDEFALVMDRFGPLAPHALGEAIIADMTRPIDLDGVMVNVGASVGIAYGAADSDGAALVGQADMAMYQAKAGNGGSRCRIFDEELAHRQRSEAAIRLEIGRPGWFGELRMLYQPIHNNREGRVCLYESLLRWQSPAIGAIAPDVLIPIAEDSGRIGEVTEWTLREALSALPKLGGAGVAVNVSPVTFRHPEFVHRLFDRLLEYRVQPGQLTIELTEGVLIENIERSRESIDRLREVGVRVVLDDFGTGFSSLSYLQHFALDGLKLDKSFLRSVGGRSQATKIIRTMVEFGHSLDMEVFVEGVENDWQLRLLQMIGCDWMQGYKVGTPAPLTDIIANLAGEAAIAAEAEAMARRSSR